MVGDPIDVEELLKRTMNNAKIAERVLKAFESDVITTADRLSQGIQEQRREEVIRLSHGLKGAAANIGAASLRALAGELEEFARDRELADATRLANELRQEVDRCLEQCPRLFARLRGAKS